MQALTVRRQARRGIFLVAFFSEAYSRGTPTPWACAYNSPTRIPKSKTHIAIISGLVLQLVTGGLNRRTISVKLWQPRRLYWPDSTHLLFLGEVGHVEGADIRRSIGKPVRPAIVLHVYCSALCAGTPRRSSRMITLFERRGNWRRSRQQEGGVPEMAASSHALR